MKKNKPKYLKLYREWVKPKGFLQTGSICMEFNYRYHYPEYSLIEPTSADIKKIKRAGHDAAYWGSGNYSIRWGIFTPLRQNLVLLMAALNNEL